MFCEGEGGNEEGSGDWFEDFMAQNPDYEKEATKKSKDGVDGGKAKGGLDLAGETGAQSDDSWLEDFMRNSPYEIATETAGRSGRGQEAEGDLDPAGDTGEQSDDSFEDFMRNNTDFDNDTVSEANQPSHKSGAGVGRAGAERAGRMLQTTLTQANFKHEGPTRAFRARPSAKKAPLTRAERQRAGVRRWHHFRSGYEHLRRQRRSFFPGVFVDFFGSRQPLLETREWSVFSKKFGVDSAVCRKIKKAKKQNTEDVIITDFVARVLHCQRRRIAMRCRETYEVLNIFLEDADGQGLDLEVRSHVNLPEDCAKHDALFHFKKLNCSKMNSKLLGILEMENLKTVLYCGDDGPITRTFNAL